MATVRWATGFVIAVGLVACRPFDEAPGSAVETGTASTPMAAPLPRAEPQPQPEPAVVRDASSPAVTRQWNGSVPDTAPEDAGGGDFCTYKVTASKITYAITSVNGAVTAATVHVVLNEAPSLPICVAHQDTFGIQEDVFTLVPNTETTGRAALSGSVDNGVGLTLFHSDLSGDSATIALQWQRDGAADKGLDFEVTATTVATPAN